MIQSQNYADVLYVHPGDVLQEKLVAFLQEGAVNLFDVSKELHDPSGVVEVQWVRLVQEEVCFFKQCIP